MIEEIKKNKFNLKEKEDEMDKNKVAILTNFMEFNPGYSLTGIVEDQCKMLQSYGHEVDLFVNSQFFQPEKTSEFSLKTKREILRINLKPIIPFAHLIDYLSCRNLSEYHEEIIKETTDMLVEELKNTPYVFTHDFIFTGWFLPYGLACIEASKQLPNTKFFHWVHSIPSLSRDWWNYNEWGGNHQIIFPNKTDSVRVAEQFKTFPKNVSCIPHIKDLRTWYDFDTDSIDFIHEYPAVMNSDIVQIYPASTDRLSSKRINMLIYIFAGLKKQGLSVCLVIANQWATGRNRKEDIQTYYKAAQTAGLDINKEFIFTSEWRVEFATGVPKRFLRNLMNCGNTFIFPTREESFGLVGAEAALCGQLVITNRSLAMMKEVHGNLTRDFEFGSFHCGLNVDSLKDYCYQISILVKSYFCDNEPLKHKTYIRQKLNWDFLYRNSYTPVMRKNETLPKNSLQKGFALNQKN